MPRDARPAESETTLTKRAQYAPHVLDDERAARPDRVFVTVRVVMPHVKKYGKDPVMELTYGCTSPLEVGDTVLCPPTRVHPSWTRGTVVSLHDNGYRGRVKYVKPLRRRAS